MTDVRPRIQARVPKKNKPLAIQVLVVALGLLLFLGLYALAMQLTVDLSKKVDSPSSLDRRDEIYGAIHLGILVVGFFTGFALGKWFSGLGLAFGALFLVVLATGMVAAQLGSHELACRGHNDLLRHWRCTSADNGPPQIPTPT